MRNENYSRKDNPVSPSSGRDYTLFSHSLEKRSGANDPKRAGKPAQVYSTEVVGVQVCIPNNVQIIIPCPVKDSSSFLGVSSTLPYRRVIESRRIRVSTDGKAQGCEERRVRVARGRACVNIEAEMEGERKWRGRKGPFAHECVSLSSVHTLCHCGAAFDTVAGVLEPRGLKACDFTCQIQESGTLPLTKKGYEEEGVDESLHRFVQLERATRLVAEESSGRNREERVNQALGERRGKPSR